VKCSRCDGIQVKDWSLCERCRDLHQERAKTVKAVWEFIRDGGGSYRNFVYDYIGETDYNSVLDGGMEIANYVCAHNEEKQSDPSL
jgi:hypothetical protein